MPAPIELSELTVAAPRTHRYAADSASAESKIPTPLRDLPQAVTVVNQDVIPDRAITQTRQLTENVSGVAPCAGYDGYRLNEQGYIIRSAAAGAPGSAALGEGEFPTLAGAVMYVRSPGWLPGP